MGEDSPDQYGFWATAAAGVAKVGAKVGKRIAKVVKAKRRIKAGIDTAKAARSVVSRPAPKKAAGAPAPSLDTRVVAVRAGVSPVLLIGGAAVVALLLLGGRK